MLRSASYSLGVHMQTPAAKTIGRKANWTALMLSVLLLVVSLHRAEAGVNVWTTNGPHSETINALAIDPQTPTTLYAGTSGHGVFKSTDGGGNWSAVNTGLTTPCGAIWVNRSEEHTSELQSRLHLVCRLLLEKKKNPRTPRHREQTAT